MTRIFLVILTALFSATICCSDTKKDQADERFVSYFINPQKEHLKLYWKDENGATFRSIGELKAWLEEKKLSLKFAMNGGMYKKDHSPQGLYIENNKTISQLDVENGTGNFYLKPNGIFFITNSNIGGISTTDDFKISSQIKYATQSGPMLLTNGKIHPAFKEGSQNLNIRNGVGILPNNEIVFAMSKGTINFYDFASYFKSLGCKNALYLDGLVSRTYHPEKDWKQLDGDFGVIIGVTFDY